MKINPNKNCFARHFAIKDKTIQKNVICKWNEDIEMEIIIYEVEEKLKELKALKLEGQDNLCPWVLKERAHEIASPAGRIFNKAANW